LFVSLVGRKLLVRVLREILHCRIGPPRIGAYVVALWLWGIIMNLLLVPGYFDIALRDFGLSLGSLALARLSVNYDLNL
jgi:hypothetical protein